MNLYSKNVLAGIVTLGYSILGIAQNKTYIQEATIHVGTGEVIENATIVCDSGKLVYIGNEAQMPAIEDGDEVITATNKQVYPGLIALNTNIGLSEIDAIRATRDFREVGDFNAHVRALSAYNTDSDVTPTLRSNGVLMAQVAPRGGTISGMSSVFKLQGENWEDAVYIQDDALFINWPQYYRQRGGGWSAPTFHKNKKWTAQCEEIYTYFKTAKAYCATIKPKKINLRLEPTRAVFAKKRAVFVRADYIKDILAAIELTKTYQLEMVIIGGRDAWMAADILKKHEIAVIISSTHGLPLRYEDDIDLSYKMPKILEDNGVTYSLGMTDFWNHRNLPFTAGTAAGYGLSKEEALKAITLNAAHILGIDHHCGSIEIGKDATLLIVDGDLLDMRTSIITHAFIEGQAVDLSNKQEVLYRRYKN